MKTRKKVLLGATAFLVTLAILLVSAVLLVNTESVQRRLMHRAVEVLTEKLNTEVQLDSVAVGLFSHDVRLIDLTVMDQQGREMLHVGHLSAKVNLWSFLRGNVRISQVRLADVRALCEKKPGEQANYQFVIDAFAPQKTKKESKKPKKNAVAIEFHDMRAERVSVRYNDISASLGWLNYQRKDTASHVVELEQAAASFFLKSKKGKVDAKASMGHLTLHLTGTKGDAQLVAVRFATDNHLPRKNTGRPKHGAFDVGHLDLQANLQLRLDSFWNEGARVTLEQGSLSDATAGIDVSRLCFDAEVTKSGLRVSHLALQWKQTEVSIPVAKLTFLNRKQGIPFSYDAPHVEGRAVLRDISKTFAPVLSQFTQPLQFSTHWSGDVQEMRFADVVVKTPDRKLTVEAQGRITDLNDKYKMVVGFDVQRMVARGSIKRTIINQFPVKKFMMKQLEALGNISYRGSFKVLWKQEQFNGTLQTQPGGVRFQLVIDDQSHYLKGHVSTRDMQLGKVFDYPSIGNIACAADFKFDISKTRTAQMRRQKKGKLPIGEVSATVDEVVFKGLKMKNLTTVIKSDGAEAQGEVAQRNARVDLLCGFSFTNTDELRKMRIKPAVKLHALSEKDRQAKEQRKAQKKAEKEARRQHKIAEKEARKAEKAARKAEKEAKKAGGGT